MNVGDSAKMVTRKLFVERTEDEAKGIDGEEKEDDEKQGNARIKTSQERERGKCSF